MGAFSVSNAFCPIAAVAGTRLDTRRLPSLPAQVIEQADIALLDILEQCRVRCERVGADYGAQVAPVVCVLPVDQRGKPSDACGEGLRCAGHGHGGRLIEQPVRARRLCCRR